MVADLNDYPPKNLATEKIVLLVVSTQGEGEPPVAAEEFHQWLLGPRAPKLAGLQFAVCGLGDTSYVQFCRIGKDFDARLEALGASRLIARVDCDVDFEAPVNAWMTGCPNGCARPYLAEIGLVGKSPGYYNLYLGAAHDGSRLNKLYREMLGEAGIIHALDPLFAAYAKERQRGERFGDFVIRKAYINATTHGANFHVI